MRDIDFLPDWCRLLKRRSQRVLVHAWTTAATMALLTLWLLNTAHAAHIRRAALADLRGGLNRARSELKLLDDQLRLRQQLDQQRALMDRVGLEVEGSRLLRELDRLLPPDMYLLEVDAEVRDVMLSANQKAGLSTPTPVDNKTQGIAERRLEVRVVGVAPSDAGVARFLAALAARPHLDRVAMTYARDQNNQSHVVREFEVTFSIDLNRPISQ